MALQAEAREATSPRKDAAALTAPARTASDPSPAALVNTDLDKHEKHTTPTDTSEATTAPSDEALKADGLTRKDSRILVQGDSLSTLDGTVSATQSGLLDSIEADEAFDKVAESPSRSRKRVGRMSSVKKTLLPAITDTSTNPSSEVSTQLWGEQMPISEWTADLGYQPFRITDSAAVRRSLLRKHQDVSK